MRVLRNGRVDLMQPTMNVDVQMTCRRAVARWLAIAFIVSGVTAPCARAGAAETQPTAGAPQWLVLGAGRMAYLKEDGRLLAQRDGVTPDAVMPYASFARGMVPGDCHTLPRGTPVRTLELQGSLDLDGITTPLFEIATADGNPIGVVDATLLQPFVPVGTVLEALTVGDYRAQLWTTQTDSADNEIADANGPKKTINLDSHTLVEVVAQAPYDRAADLQVRVLTGHLRGRTGWMVQLFVPHTQFAADDFIFSTKIDPATLFR